jgi:hypothetical protein
MGYEVRFPPPATRGLTEALGNGRMLRWRIRMLASRAAIHAPSLRARSAVGRLAEPGPVADGRTIGWVCSREGGFFVVRAGWNRAACDVLPERRIVVVFAVADAPTLAAALGIDRYSFVHTVFSSR